jgi:hypothetical protein
MPGRINAYGGLVTKEPIYNANTYGYGFRQRTNNSFWFVIGHEASDFFLSSSTKIVAGTWYYLAGTYDGSNLRLYVNGVLERSGLVNGITINSTADLKIGILNSISEPFEGIIDEVSIWKVARTEAEIQADMNGSIDVNDHNLVAYFPFNQGVAGGDNSGVTTLADTTANNNDGTLNNFALLGSTSNWVTSNTGCLPPTNLFAHHFTSSSAKLTWDAVPHAQAYKILYQALNSGVWTQDRAGTNSKTLTGLLPGTEYKWKVESYCELTVNSAWSATNTFATTPLTSTDALQEQLQTSFQIYPNPAKDHATVQFTLAQASHVYLKAYDLSGKEIAKLFEANLSSGMHSVSINTDQFSRGVYLVKMISDSGTENKKLLVE